MTRNNRALWLSAAATIAFTMSCGGNETPDGGTGSCTTDATCGTGKGCHPVLKTCVATCTGSSDCPSAEKTCAKINNSASSFCTCSTDALCAASTAGNICSAATSQCTAKCTSSASCPNNGTCNTGTGQCSGGGTTDGGMDAGTTDAGMGNNCESSNNQPDVCGYGNACNESSDTPPREFCGPIVNGTCSNVAGRPAWSSASTGPVIFNVVDEADVQTDCTADNAFTMTVYAYAGPGMAFPAQKSALPGFFYYTTNGTQVDIPTNLLRQSNYTLFGTTVIGAKFTVCSSATSSIVVGVGFTNGNGFCTTLTR